MLEILHSKINTVQIAQKLLYRKCVAHISLNDAGLANPRITEENQLEPRGIRTNFWKHVRFLLHLFLFRSAAIGPATTHDGDPRAEIRGQPQCAFPADDSQPIRGERFH